MASKAASSGFQAVIFDLDGTLVDTEQVTLDWIAQLLAPHGLEWTADLHRQIMGTVHFFPRRCLELLGVPQERLQELLPVLPERLTSPEYSAYVASRLKFKPGAAALIQSLRSRRLPLALCTSRRADSLAQIEAARPDFKALLEPLTVRVVGSTDPRTGQRVPGKPDPSVFRICTELLGVPPEACLVFEDSPSGVESARAAGAFTVAVPEAWAEPDAASELVFAQAELRLSSLLDFDEAGVLGPAPPLLLGCGNPTVDLTCEVSSDELAQLGLAPGMEAAGLSDEVKAGIVAFAMGREGATVSPGGAALNALRVAAWAGGAALRAAFVGSVGRDAHAAVLRDAALEAGVVPLLHEDPNEPTGISASLVERTSRDRCLATRRGAAASLSPEFVREPGVAAIVDQAALFYVTSFALSSQPRIAAVEALGGAVGGRGGALAVNLSSAGLLPKVMDPLLRLLPRCRYAFGNLGELRALAKLLRWPAADAGASAEGGGDGRGALAAALAEQLAEGGTAVVTAGAEATLVATRGGGVQSFAVPAVPQSEIVDTNAAGDSFVGGFLAKALVDGAPLESCVAAGHEASAFILRRRGCDLRPAGASS